MQLMRLLLLTVCWILIDAFKKVLSAGPSKRLHDETHDETHESYVAS